MNINKEAEKYCKYKDVNEGEQWPNDYEELPLAMADFAKRILNKILDEWSEKKATEFIDRNLPGVKGLPIIVRVQGIQMAIKEIKKQINE